MTQLPAPSTSPTTPVSLLILGAGWTSTYLLPLLASHNITHAATTRTGHHNTIPFTFDPSPTAPSTPYTHLPPAHTILITFPLRGPAQSALLIHLYATTHPSTAPRTRYIQLGSTGIFQSPSWNDDSTPYDRTDPRAVAEDELLAVLGDRACVLCLAGLYGGARRPAEWVVRVARSKADVAAKGAVHLVHGGDVGRAVVGCVEGWEGVAGRRWIVTDLHVYDWWELILCWGREAREREGEGGVGLGYEGWVVELMGEEGVRGLPRGVERLGRVLDGRGFWRAIGGAPGEGRVS